MSDLVSPVAARYAEAHTTPLTEDLQQVASWTQAHTASPMMMSGLAEVRLLQALITVAGARRVLEIGTFTGLGTLAMAAATGPAGRVVTLEADTATADVARQHFQASPHGERIELVVGDAKATLNGLTGPFDLVYIDAWKADYPTYYEAALGKLADRGVIVADNLYRGGRALSPDGADENTAGIRAFAALVQDDPRVENVLLSVGDGLMLAWRPALTAAEPADR